MNSQERFQQVADLVEQGNYADATREVVWLWDHMLEEDRSLYGVRGSYLVNWMKHLSNLDESARQQFKDLRDKLSPVIELDDPDFYLVSDWFTLSDRLLDDDVSIERWIDQLLSADDEPHVLRVMRKTIHAWLCDHDHWETAGTLLEPASLLIARAKLRAEEEKHGNRFEDETLLTLADMRLRDLVRQHASYLAAGRDEEAWEIAEAVRELYDKEQASTALREMARKAGVESERHKTFSSEHDECD